MFEIDLYYLRSDQYRRSSSRGERMPWYALTHRQGMMYRVTHGDLDSYRAGEV